jgi:hypothetical protein
MGKGFSKSQQIRRSTSRKTNHYLNTFWVMGKIDSQLKDSCSGQLAPRELEISVVFWPRKLSGCITYFPLIREIRCLAQAWLHSARRLFCCCLRISRLHGHRLCSRSTLETRLAALRFSHDVSIDAVFEISNPPDEMEPEINWLDSSTYHCLKCSRHDSDLPYYHCTSGHLEDASKRMM